MNKNINIQKKKILRSTRSVCPFCCRELQAHYTLENGAIILEKKCPEHGDCSVVLSTLPQYFMDLVNAYFTLMPENLPQNVLELVLTPRCSMNCPICSVMSSVGRYATQMNASDVRKIMSENSKREFILWGMESTDNPELKEIISLLKSRNINACLFTNGLKLADFNYLNNLKESGLSQVYLQFDGFDESINQTLRNTLLLENKLAVLENLKKLNIATSLNFTLAKGINENQISRIIDYAVKNDFIRQIGFLPLIKVGRADDYRQDIVPNLHEFLTIIERETKGRISLDNLRIFQKLMYVIYRLVRFRRCFWFSLFLLFRDKKKSDYITINELVDFKKIDTLVNSYISGVKNKCGFRKDIKLILGLIGIFLNFKTLPLIRSFIIFFIMGKKVQYARLNKSILFITCTDFCDFYKMDLQMSDQYCEEMLVLKNDKNELIYEPTYLMMIEGFRRSIPS